MQHPLCWFEIPATNVERAVTFYNEIFAINLTVIDCGKEKMACFPDMNGLSGAISMASGFKPSKNGVQITFHGGDDLDEMLKKVTKAGGTIIRQKTKIEVEGRGYFALFGDTEGNTIGLYSDS